MDTVLPFPCVWLCGCVGGAISIHTHMTNALEGSSPNSRPPEKELANLIYEPSDLKAMTIARRSVTPSRHPTILSRKR